MSQCAEFLIRAQFCNNKGAIQAKQRMPKIKFLIFQKWQNLLFKICEINHDLNDEHFEHWVRCWQRSGDYAWWQSWRHGSLLLSWQQREWFFNAGWQMYCSGSISPPPPSSTRREFQDFLCKINHDYNDISSNVSLSRAAGLVHYPSGASHSLQQATKFNLMMSSFHSKFASAHNSLQCCQF